jgi:hypothetical protein
MAMTKRQREKREQALSDIEQRLKDIFAGAAGGPFDEEIGEPISQLGAEGLERFLRAVLAQFSWERKDGTDYVYWFQPFWMGKLESLEKLSEWIFDHSLDYDGAQR